MFIKTFCNLWGCSPEAGHSNTSDINTSCDYALQEGVYTLCFDFSPATAWHIVSGCEINSWKYVVPDYVTKVHTYNSLEEW